MGTTAVARMLTALVCATLMGKDMSAQVDAKTDKQYGGDVANPFLQLGEFIVEGRH